MNKTLVASFLTKVLSYIFFSDDKGKNVTMGVLYRISLFGSCLVKPIVS